MLLFWLITIVISFIFFRKAIKEILSDEGTVVSDFDLEFRYIAILICVILFPICNLISSIGLYLYVKKVESSYDDNKESFSIRFLRKMFFIKKKYK